MINDPHRKGRRFVSTVAQTPMRGLYTHDHGASEGCLALATDVSVFLVQNEFEGSLYRAGVLAGADCEM
jgi:hypothetical protein